MTDGWIGYIDWQIKKRGQLTHWSSSPSVIARQKGKEVMLELCNPLIGVGSKLVQNDIYNLVGLSPKWPDPPSFWTRLNRKYWSSNFLHKTVKEFGQTPPPF